MTMWNNEAIRFSERGYFERLRNLKLSSDPSGLYFRTVMKF